MPPPFERPVGAQPFDKAPFCPVAIPNWVRDATGAGYTLSVMDAVGRARAAAAGVGLSEIGFVDPYYAYYDSKLLRRRSPHVPLEKIARDVAEYRRLGVRILGVYPPTLQGEVYETHPDWRRVDRDTREIPQVDLKAHPYGGMLCLLGPYGDFFIDVLDEILTQFPQVDAFSFDGLHHGGGCYCPRCRDSYRADTGDPLPPRDLNDAAYRRYLHWADRRLEALLTRMQTRLKARKPDVALVTWTTNAGRFGHLLDVPRNMPARMNLLLDAPDMELWMDETNRGASIVPAFGCAYLWAVSGRRVAFAEPYLMSRGSPYGKDSFPAHELERRMLLVLAHGAQPSLAVLQPPQLQKAAYDAIARVKRCAPWTTHKTPEPWAALAVSDNTRVLYTRGDPEPRYLASVFGAFRAGLEAHLPLTILNDWDLTPDALAPYKALWLPNTAALDDSQVAAIRRFVERGGGLVASLDAGLCDAFGTPRSQPALADLLGVDHLGPALADAPPDPLDVNFARTLPPEYWTKRRGAWELRREPGSFLDALGTLLGDAPVTFKGPAVRVRPHPGARVIATLHARDASPAPPTPAVVTRTFGRGKVVFFAAGIDAANYLAPYPYYRVALAAALRWAAASPPPVEVVAPLCVHAVTTRQRKNGERLIVSLYNDINTAAFHGMPGEEVPLREETLPIFGIVVRFVGPRIARVHLEPGGTTLPVTRRGSVCEVTVPRLDIHALVVAERAP